MRLARKGLNTSAPNPRVGCVIVRDGAIAGEGWHAKAGGDHAEIVALKQAGELARGATCYITLEPCSHSGRTPPCTSALINAGVARVITAMIDPNPRVSGRGLSVLVEHGIEAVPGLLEAEAAALNAGYIKRRRRGLPRVRCKLAMSLDGRTAAADGDSKWITGEAARRDVQRWRARSCAIMAGAGTVCRDDPRLNVRGIDTLGRQPLRVIADRRLALPETAMILQQPGRTLVFTESRDPARTAALAARGAEIIRLEDEVFLEACLRHLAGVEEVNELLVEAGAVLAGAMLRSGLVDELIVYQSPVLLGDGGRGLFHLPELKTMADCIRLVPVETRRVGEDLRCIYRFPGGED